jgi:hypothetical protein
MAAVPIALRSQNTGTAPNQGAGQAGNPAAQGNVLRITSPKTGERLHQNFVNIQFELINGGASASGMPNFQVKLDSLDPVTTNSTNYTFNSLAPGPHTVTVQLVDANGTPVAGARGEVQFVVPQAAPAPGATIALRHRRPMMIAAALRVEEPQAPAKDDELPSAAGALPLLSVIGFGVLLGGIASAMRTRPKYIVLFLTVELHEGTAPGCALLLLGRSPTPFARLWI